MMAARGNAAKKGMEAKANQSKKKSQPEIITSEELEHFKKLEEEKEKNKVKDKWADPECAGNPITRKWMEASAKLRSVAYGERFEAFILVCIIIAGIIVGIMTYEGMDHNQVVKVSSFYHCLSR